MRPPNLLFIFTDEQRYDTMGSHRLIAKCVAFEEAIRVPLLVRQPGQQSAARVETPVSQIDLVPALLDLMGQPVPEGLQGASLRPCFEGRAEAPPGDVFVEWNGHNNGLGDVIGQVSIPEPLRELAAKDEIISAITDPVRTVITPDGWKLNCSPRGEHELYNLTRTHSRHRTWPARSERR